MFTEKTIEQLTALLSEETIISAQVSKKIIDNLVARGLSPEMFGSVVWHIKTRIQDAAIAESLNKVKDEDIGSAIDEIVMDCWGYSEREVVSEITLAESEEFSEDKAYELITTAKQTDHRYGDFEYTKADLEKMAANFNENIVGTEIPVDLNHDPEHIAYAWIKPGSMEVKESSTLEGQYSLYAQLYRFTPEGKDMITTGKVRYFSLQIQNVFTKFVDKAKKTYNLVIRALALTNMPVIKDMAPTYAEAKTLFSDHTNTMTNEELQAKQLSEKDTIISAKDVALSEKDVALAEKETENKKLAEDLKKLNDEKREKLLSEEVESLCLSEDKAIGFKAGEKDKVLAFVKTLSDEQATQYFAIHKEILSNVDLAEYGDAGEGEQVTDTTANDIAEKRAKELAEKEGIDQSSAMKRVLSEDKDLASKVL